MTDRVWTEQVVANMKAETLIGKKINWALMQTVRSDLQKYKNYFAMNCRPERIRYSIEILINYRFINLRKKTNLFLKVSPFGRRI